MGGDGQGWCSDAGLRRGLGNSTPSWVPPPVQGDLLGIWRAQDNWWGAHCTSGTGLHRLISVNQHKHTGLLVPLCRGGGWGKGGFRNMPKVTQLWRSQLWTQAMWLQSLCSWPLARLALRKWDKGALLFCGGQEGRAPTVCYKHARRFIIHCLTPSGKISIFVLIWNLRVDRKRTRMSVGAAEGTDALSSTTPLGTFGNGSDI